MRHGAATLLLAWTLALAAPAHAADTTAARLDALEQRVARLEALAAAEANQATALITLVRWSAAFKQDDLSKSYRISYTLKSHCDKPIKLVEGNLDFYAPDGKRIFSIPLVREAPLDASAEATFAGTYFINPARPEEVRLRDLPPTEISTRLQLRRIVFRDNTVLPLE